MARQELSYWEKREIQRYKELEKLQKKETNYTLLQYRKESERINKEVYSLYAKYAEENRLTISEARKVLNATETTNFHRKMRAYKEQLKEGGNPEIVKKISAMEKRARIKRLEALDMEIESRLAILGKNQVNHYKNYKYRTAKTSYKSSIAMIKERYKVKPKLDSLSKKVLIVMVDYPYQGEYFSDNIWSNTGYVASKAKQEVLNGILTGQHVRTTAKNLDKIMGRGYSNAERLIRTETNLLINLANQEGYKQTGIEQYEYAAVMDEKTSTICRKLDGKIFNVEDAIVGVNQPPMHPYCRSITMPIFDEDSD